MLSSRQTHEILELPSGLLNDTILSLEHDAHPREVSDLGRAYNERV